MPWPVFSKFLLVGLLNTLIGYSIFALLTLLGLGPSIALSFTYVFGVIVNYYTTGTLVFNSLSTGAFVRFVLSYVAVYFINFFALTQLIQLGLSQLLAQAIVTPFAAMLSFVMFKKLVFRVP